MSVWINTQFSDDWEAGPPEVTCPEDRDSILDVRKGFPGGMDDQSRRKPGGILVQSWHQLWHQLSPPCHLSPGSPLSLLTTCHFLLGSSCNKLQHCTSVFKILCCQEQSLVMSLNLSPGKWLMPEKTACHSKDSGDGSDDGTSHYRHLPLFSPPSSNHSVINEEQQLVHLPYFLCKSWPEGSFFFPSIICLIWGFFFNFILFFNFTILY